MASPKPISESGRLLIRVYDPYDRPAVKLVDSATMSIGSAPGSTIQLNGRDVAPHHAAFKFHGGRCFIEPKGGNTIEMGGQSIGRLAEVPFGVMIYLGSFKLVIEQVAGSLKTAEPEDKEKEVGSPVQIYQRKVRDALLDRLDLRRQDITRVDDQELRKHVEALLLEIIKRPETQLPSTMVAEQFVKELADECLALGPIEDLLRDRDVSEIMVIDSQNIYVERRGKITLEKRVFSSDDALETVIQRIVRPLGRRVDKSVPMVDARLKDGSRVNAVLPPLAVRGPCLTIRKFPSDPLMTDDLIKFGSLTPRMARFLSRAVKSRQNILISGGTGSGKTTLLNIMSSFIQSDERIITVEDAAELQMKQEHVVSMETRPPSLEGKGEYTIRDLVRNALRMRPDRIIVGECRGPEALDMLQAMNTGHDGSMTTIHANAPTEALSRLETLVLFADQGLSSQAIREQIAMSIDVVVQQARLQGGARKITNIAEIVGLDSQGRFVVEDIFRFVPEHVDEKGRLQGRFRMTGHLPSFLADLITLGLAKPGEYI